MSRCALGKVEARGDSLKQRRIPCIVNFFEVSDPSQIKALANDPVVDRFFDTRTCPLNWFLLKRSLAVLSFKGQRFPTMEPRLCEKRARAQDELWRKLNDQVATVRAGPIGLAPLSEWVKGVGSEAEVGILAQQVLGRLFRNDFAAGVGQERHQDPLQRAKRTDPAASAFSPRTTAHCRVDCRSLFTPVELEHSMARHCRLVAVSGGRQRAMHRENTVLWRKP